ncbi:MAG: SsrA-binding protein SmpB [Spirochaetales bacterium]|nr:SsrA-binding protein SmpB [Spirochaetales bacterium]
MSGIKILAENRKARFNYEILDSYEAGIALVGTEVKSVRAGKISFADSYADIFNREVFLIGLRISPYDHGNIFNHEPDRKKKLLLHKEEIHKMKRSIDEKGLTLVPLKFYLKKGLVKVEIGVCKGKKLHDKRESIKEKDQKRDTDREMKGRG